MKNLAGHDVSIYLFRFVLRKSAISFVLNEAIAEDLYPESERQLQPLVQACSETLLRHKTHCQANTIMDGNILTDGYFEVQLSPGLGKHFDPREKQALFHDANEIAQLLMAVMDRRTQEMEQGTYPGPQAVINQIQRTGTPNAGLEALGQKHHQDTLGEGHPPPYLARLTPDDLPPGVVARRSYDHRGHCIAFEHTTFGLLGRIILIDRGGETLLEAEISQEHPQYLTQKRQIFEAILAVIDARF